MEKLGKWVDCATLGNCITLRGEVEIAEKEIIELDNRKEVAEKEEVAGISLTQEEKKRKREI